MPTAEPWHAKAFFAAVLAVCALVPWAQQAPLPSEHPRGAIEWPTEWDGRVLRPLATTAVERRFLARFPGHVARVTDGEQVLVLRQVHQPTRMLHPAAHCYRGLGYRISDTQLERDPQARLWRCFIAERGTQRTRVCERIVDAQGQAFTDTSNWFWAAQLGQSHGPWQAVTTARAL